MRVLGMVVVTVIAGAALSWSADGQQYFSVKGTPGQYMGYVSGPYFITCKHNKIKMDLYKDFVVTKATTYCPSSAQTDSAVDADETPAQIEAERAAAAKEEKMRMDEMAAIAKLPKKVP